MESSSQPSSGMTAAGLPVKGRSAKASTWVKSATIMSGPCRVHGPAAGRDALPGRGGSALLYPERPLPAFLHLVHHLMCVGNGHRRINPHVELDEIMGAACSGAKVVRSEEHTS